MSSPLKDSIFPKPSSPLFAVNNEAMSKPDTEVIEVPLMEQLNSMEHFNLGETSSPMFLNSQGVAFSNVKREDLSKTSVKATEVPQMEQPNSMEHFSLGEMSSPMFLNSQGVALFNVKREAFSPDNIIAEEVHQMGQQNSIEHLHLKEEKYPFFQVQHKSPTFLDVKREVTEEPNAPVMVKEEMVPMDELLHPQLSEYLNAENLNSGPGQVTESDSDGLDEHDVYYINEKNPYFEMFLDETHVNPPYSVELPADVVCKLPRVSVPVVIRCESKSWNLFYTGKSKTPKFHRATWKYFVRGNNLNMGDVCVFEVIHQSDTIIKFKVIILRCGLPPDLTARVNTCGTKSNPIVF